MHCINGHNFYGDVIFTTSGRVREGRTTTRRELPPLARSASDDQITVIDRELGVI